MRIAYLDCFAGIAGDMFLGALLDAGVPREVLLEATAALNVGASLRIETVDRSGISSIKVHVLENGDLAEGEKHTHVHEHDDAQHQRSADMLAHTHQLKTQHQHKVGHSHEHQHGHSHEHAHEPHAHKHGRSLTEIKVLIAAAKLEQPVKALAIRAFELLGASEAKIHNVPVEEIHFHEVGAVDAIVDIVAASAGVHHLKIASWYASAVNVGGGMVECAHGTFPVPAPATADLLRGYPTYSAHIQKELVTPTGAALLRALQPSFGVQPPMAVEAIGYGAGTRNPKDFPNVLRLSLGESTELRKPSREAEPTSAEADVVTVLETALDDLSPQVTAYVAEKALAMGALDVMLQPVTMKKGRPGTLMTVLCEPSRAEELESLLLRETSTLGVRVRQDRRVCLQRHHVPVETPYGTIRVKVGSQNGEERNVAAEFEDCRAAAIEHGVPLKVVQQAALAGYSR